LLPQICRVVLDAERAHAFRTEGTKAMAARAEAILMGLATVGVISLVDEATGYQEQRDRAELRRIFEEYISEDLRPWTKRFPDEFFEEIFRLHEWKYKPDTAARPGYVGTLINHYIYERLPIGVLEGLRVRNPRDDSGRRAHRHHQFLTADTGNPHLDRQIIRVLTLMQGSENLGSFDRAFRRVFPAVGDQIEIDGLDAA
jgi:hypothetical protein